MGLGDQIINNADVVWSSIEECVEDKDLITQSCLLASMYMCIHTNTHKHTQRQI